MQFIFFVGLNTDSWRYFVWVHNILYKMFGEKIGKNHSIEAHNRNLVKSVIDNGGVIIPLLINSIDSKGLGLCNPSIFIDNGKPMLILRNINYTLYHAEGTQSFNSRYGCLAYLNPENDKHLRTWNYLCELNPDTLAIEKYWLIDTKQFDKPPLWEFVGLEDARLVRWEGKLYGIGVRRDTTTNGQGRMEFSRISKSVNGVKEISRDRIENTDPKAYCEKNWMPVIDMPNCFVKWTNPTAVVKVDLKTNTCEHIFHGKEAVEGLPFFRGSSQVIPYGNYRICIVHECDLFSNKLLQKDATYLHRFVIWDKEWNIVKITKPFSFMDGEIEFCCGMALYKNDLLISFGFQDNAAFILKVPHDYIKELLSISDGFEWGLVEENKWFKNWINKEIFVDDAYQRFTRVKEGDTVLDLGANIGAFTHKILPQKPKKVYCVEPNQGYFGTLLKNVGDKNTTCLGKAIGGQSKKDTLTFVEVIQMTGQIDFLKIDIEGAEYDVFTKENLLLIKEKVKYIAGEFHTETEQQKNLFKEFREIYLKEFSWHKVYSADGIDITWDLFNEHFLNYYKNFLLYIDITKTEKWRVTDFPTLEITTNIFKKGCPCDCAFCPQDKVIKNYNGEEILSLGNFKKVIDNLPKEINITFSGFSEPFLNKDCADMILYAHEKGHNVSVFTTAVGLTANDIDRIKHIPFQGGQGGFTLHLPDKDYAKYKIHPDTLKKLSETNIYGFSSVIMGELEEPFKSIFPNTTKQTMYSRAGNLEREDLKYNITSPTLEKKTCGCREKLYHPVMIPNGDVVLCCQDWSLKHGLGNLFTQSYNEVVPDNNTPFALCSGCENGIKA